MSQPSTETKQLTDLIHRIEMIINDNLNQHLDEHEIKYLFNGTFDVKLLLLLLVLLAAVGFALPRRSAGWEWRVDP